MSGCHVPISELPVCKMCRGNGYYWWTDPEPSYLHKNDDPGPRVRNKRTCDNCFGIGYTNGIVIVSI